MNAGSITISTELDNKELEREYTATVKKIRSLTDKINTAQAKRSPAADQSAAVAAELDAAKAQLDYMKSGQEFFTAGAIQQQEASVKSIQKDWDKAQTSVEKYDAQISAASTELSVNEEKAGAIASEMTAAGRNTSLMGDSLDAVGIRMNKLFTRIQKLAARILFFSIITMGLRSVREWLGNVIKTNGEASQAVARLRAALLTMAQPLVNVVIPAFTFFVRVLTQVIMTIASLFSALSGTTVEQSEKSAEALNGETSALKGTGAAAKKAAKSLAAFDEINKLSSDDSGSGGSSGSEIAPDFSYAKEYGDRLKDIATAVMLIGTGLALWKVSSILPEQLGAVAKTLAGIAIAVGGLIIMWGGLKDAWDNGIDWGNLIQMLLGAAIAVGGLYLAFGKLGAAIGLIVTGLAIFTTGIKDAFENGVNWQNIIAILTGATAAVIGLYLAFGKIGAGIGLIVSGITMLITGFKDVMTNGADLQNTLLIIAGIVATGLGISLLTGNLLPALVAGVLAVIYAFVAWQGNAEELATNLKLILTGIIDFLTGVFTGDWEKAWNGLKDVFKGIINSIIIIFESVINGVITGINFLIEKINTLHWDIPEWVPGIGGESFGFSVNPLQKVTLPRVPALATGAVIPPNREFMAILGDQKHGTNIEAPEELIRRIVREETAAMGGDLNLNQTINLDGEVVYRNQKKVTRRHGTVLV